MPLVMIYPTILYYYSTVEPLYKGHIGTSHFVHCREVVHSSEVKICISTIGKLIFGALESVLCREIISIVSFIQTVLY